MKEGVHRVVKIFFDTKIRKLVMEAGREDDTGASTSVFYPCLSIVNGNLDRIYNLLELVGRGGVSDVLPYLGDFGKEVVTRHKGSEECKVHPRCRQFGLISLNNIASGLGSGRVIESYHALTHRRFLIIR